jgi:hypothetical protein
VGPDAFWHRISPVSRSPLALFNQHTTGGGLLDPNSLATPPACQSEQEPGTAACTGRSRFGDSGSIKGTAKEAELKVRRRRYAQNREADRRALEEIYEAEDTRHRG